MDSPFISSKILLHMRPCVKKQAWGGADDGLGLAGARGLGSVKVHVDVDGLLLGIRHFGRGLLLELLRGTDDLLGRLDLGVLDLLLALDGRQRFFWRFFGRRRRVRARDDAALARSDHGTARGASGK